MAKVDPNRKRKLESILTDIQGHFKTYQTYRKQTGAAAAEVGSWSIDKYLDVMESFNIVTRIKHPEEKWGEIWFKCSCKYCHVHACCGESLLFSMVLNKKLLLPPKWSRLEPSDRKRRGRPTDKRVEKLKAADGEIDARPFPDKAEPRAPLRVREIDWGTNPGPGPTEASEPAAASAATEPSTALAKPRSKGSRAPKKVCTVHLFLSVSVSLYLLKIHTGFVSARGWHWILIECQNTQGMIYCSV